ncbi:PIR Superfamily Protein [Plasmodium malariae]|uniref:PIR Superfamily Protein n=1 Tax=Plasmodium malariae TaxID=5858 RepID=A0A1A8X5D0_PLAMA|nr:PIR Superfamily Protein [Plasmodium malariae]
MSSDSTVSESVVHNTPVFDELKKKYPFLVYWPDYSFEGLRGIYKSKYEDMCIYNNGSVYNRPYCIKLFSILESLFIRRGLGANNKIFEEGKKWFKENKESIKLNSDEMNDFIKKLGVSLEETYVNDFKTYQGLYGNNTEVIDILKLYYFSENSGTINHIMGSPDHKDYYSTCKFINECLEIYNKYKNFKCSGNNNITYSNPSTICAEVNHFYSKYKLHLYYTLRGMHNISKGTTNDTAPIKCLRDPSESSFFGENQKLSTGGKAGVAILSVFGIFLIFYMLYKLTPLGNLMYPRGRRIRKMWRNVESFDEQVNFDHSTNMDQPNRRETSGERVTSEKYRFMFN